MADLLAWRQKRPYQLCILPRSCNSASLDIKTVGSAMSKATKKKGFAAKAFRMIKNVQSDARWWYQLADQNKSTPVWCYQIKTIVTAVNNSCFLSYLRSLASSSSFSRTVLRLTQHVRQLAFLAVTCNFAKRSPIIFKFFQHRLSSKFAEKAVTENLAIPHTSSYSALRFIVNQNACFRLPLVFCH